MHGIYENLSSGGEGIISPIVKENTGAPDTFQIEDVQKQVTHLVEEARKEIDKGIVLVPVTVSKVEKNTAIAKELSQRIDTYLKTNRIKGDSDTIVKSMTDAGVISDGKVDTTKLDDFIHSEDFHKHIESTSDLPALTPSDDAVLRDVVGAGFAAVLLKTASGALITEESNVVHTVREGNQLLQLNEPITSYKNIDSTFAAGLSQVISPELYALIKESNWDGVAVAEKIKSSGIEDSIRHYVKEHFDSVHADKISATLIDSIYTNLRSGNGVVPTIVKEHVLFSPVEPEETAKDGAMVKTRTEVIKQGLSETINQAADEVSNGRVIIPAAIGMAVITPAIISTDMGVRIRGYFKSNGIHGDVDTIIQHISERVSVNGNVLDLKSLHEYLESPEFADQIEPVNTLSREEIQQGLDDIFAQTSLDIQQSGVAVVPDNIGSQLAAGTLLTVTVLGVAQYVRQVNYSGTVIPPQVQNPAGSSFINRVAFRFSGLRNKIKNPGVGVYTHIPVLTPGIINGLPLAVIGMNRIKPLHILEKELDDYWMAIQVYKHSHRRRLGLLGLIHERFVKQTVLTKIGLYTKVINPLNPSQAIYVHSFRLYRYRLWNNFLDRISQIKFGKKGRRLLKFLSIRSRRLRIPLIKRLKRFVRKVVRKAIKYAVRAAFFVAGTALVYIGKGVSYIGKAVSAIPIVGTILGGALMAGGQGITAAGNFVKKIPKYLENFAKNIANFIPFFGKLKRRGKKITMVAGIWSAGIIAGLPLLPGKFMYFLKDHFQQFVEWGANQGLNQVGNWFGSHTPGFMHSAGNWIQGHTPGFMSNFGNWLGSHGVGSWIPTPQSAVHFMLHPISVVQATWNHIPVIGPFMGQLQTAPLQGVAWAGNKAFDLTIGNVAHAADMVLQAFLGAVDVIAGFIMLMGKALKGDLQNQWMSFLMIGMGLMLLNTNYAGTTTASAIQTPKQSGGCGTSCSTGGNGTTTVCPSSGPDVGFCPIGGQACVPGALNACSPYTPTPPGGSGGPTGDPVCDGAALYNGSQIASQYASTSSNIYPFLGASTPASVWNQYGSHGVPSTAVCYSLGDPGCFWNAWCVPFVSKAVGNEVLVPQGITINPGYTVTGSGGSSYTWDPTGWSITGIKAGDLLYWYSSGSISGYHIDIVSGIQSDGSGNYLLQTIDGDWSINGLSVLEDNSFTIGGNGYIEGSSMHIIDIYSFNKPSSCG